ncbi:unnamed protein product [Cylindrotheca closterium]|uniref:Uncharacterized protein n=1 Tax=Cylindrotheca closterium TaxID=2856 RepID=A0AAD2FSQ6_9STRA|nr:unnamed protein product [Cylindrotheca closterium]
MTMKGKAEEYPSGINVQNGHLQIDNILWELPNEAIRKCSTLVQVSLPTSVRVIGEYCFAQCTSLKTAEIPNSVEVVGKAAFYYCTNLTDVTIAQDQSKLRVIGELAFGVCRALKTIETPETVAEIAPKAFQACLDLEKATITGNKLRSVEEEVFSGCSSLTEVLLPYSVTIIKKQAFRGCRKLHTALQQGQQQEIGVKRAFLPSIVHIGNGAFESCQSIETFQLSGNIRTIGQYSFKDCENLEHFEFPEGLEVIEDRAMARCFALGFARLPTSLISIGEEAFHSCETLQSVIMAPKKLSRLRSVGHRAFGRCLSLCNIYFPTNASVGITALEGCERLKELVKGYAWSDDQIIELYQGRFDGLPLHQLCYHQSYFSTKELGEILCSGARMAEDVNGIDVCGMTPLHLLALARVSNLDLWNYMIGQNRSNIMAMDNRGHLPLGYLLLNNCEPTILDLYFSARHESYPYQSSLEYIAENTLPYSRVKLHVVLQLSLQRLVEDLENEEWKQSVMDEANEICKSFNSKDRIRKASQLQCNTLQKYQMKKVSSLLELAVWNVKIHETTTKKTHAASSSPEDKIHRQNCRLQCGDEVIIRNVLPFLPFEIKDGDFELIGRMNGKPIPDFRYGPKPQDVRYVQAPQTVSLASLFGVEYW